MKKFLNVVASILLLIVWPAVAIKYAIRCSRRNVHDLEETFAALATIGSVNFTMIVFWSFFFHRYHAQMNWVFYLVGFVIAVLYVIGLLSCVHRATKVQDKLAGFSV